MAVLSREIYMTGDGTLLCARWRRRGQVNCRELKPLSPWRAAIIHRAIAGNKLAIDRRVVPLLTALEGCLVRRSHMVDLTYRLGYRPMEPAIQQQVEPKGRVSLWRRFLTWFRPAFAI